MRVVTGAFLKVFNNFLCYINLQGDDMYSSTHDHSQGSGFLGYGILIDTQGDDLYRSLRTSQGVGFFGYGAIIDWDGDDSYLAQEFSQGVALGGKGFIFDRKGKDQYQAALFSQAVGLTYGIGSIFDIFGDDSYILGNRDFSSYGSVGIFKGAGQGFGFGIRHISSGGIGFLYDYKGNDLKSEYDPENDDLLMERAIGLIDSCNLRNYIY